MTSYNVNISNRRSKNHKRTYCTCTEITRPWTEVSEIRHEIIQDPIFHMDLSLQTTMYRYKKDTLSLFQAEIIKKIKPPSPI